MNDNIDEGGELNFRITSYGDVPGIQSETL